MYVYFIFKNFNGRFEKVHIFNYPWNKDLEIQYGISKILKNKN